MCWLGGEHGVSSQDDPVLETSAGNKGVERAAATSPGSIAAAGQVHWSLGAPALDVASRVATDECGWGAAKDVAAGWHKAAAVVLV